MQSVLLANKQKTYTKFTPAQAKAIPLRILLSCMECCSVTVLEEFSGRLYVNHWKNAIIMQALARIKDLHVDI